MSNTKTGRYICQWLRDTYALTMHPAAQEYCFCLKDIVQDVQLDVRVCLRRAQLEIRSPLAIVKPGAEPRVLDMLVHCQQAEHAAANDNGIIWSRLRPRLAYLPTDKQIFVEAVIDFEHFATPVDLQQFFDAALQFMADLHRPSARLFDARS